MRTRFLIIPAAALALAACGGNAQKKASGDQIETLSEVAADMHNAETALDYLGTYKGTLPAADCPGIEVTLTLHADGTYTEHDSYLERKTVFDEKGGYEVKENLLTLTPVDGEGVNYYKVEENRLRKLDADKQPITGDLAEYYVLNKTL